MDLLAIIGILVCCVVQPRIHRTWISVTVSVVVVLATWILVVFALSQVFPHPLVPAGSLGYSLAVALAIAIALVVAAIRYMVARYRRNAQQ